MQTLELNDIQGIILRGYGNMQAADFVLLQVRDAAAARRWLEEVADEIMDGTERPPESCANIAFTRAGLAALGLDEAVLGTFSFEFQEGMVGSEHRQRILGDVGTSAPGNWQWGGPGGSPVHILLLLYALDEASLDAFFESHRQRFEASGLSLVTKLDSLRLPEQKEHFGFRDGIAQPLIAGYKEGSPGNTISAGEFIFGYPDEYGALPPTPTVEASGDPRSLLPDHEELTGRRDLGRNGSYLVMRQLRQDVPAFWQCVDGATRQSDGSSDPAARTRLASKMVGRWPNGAPLTLSPERDDPAMMNEDGFLYHEKDAQGERCPIGAHIRRTNPRDSLEPDPGSEKSIAVGKRHRIIRRGRAYGNPIASSMQTDEIASAVDDGVERGIHFICFNTNINRQFEFIQHTWANNPKFGGLYQDADPIIGEHDPDGTGKKGVFSVPGPPVRQRVTGLTRFVTVRGGAYFFMPGKRALRYLAALG